MTKKLKISFKNFKKSFKRMDAFKWILFSVVMIYVLSMIFVLYFGLVNSLKDDFDFFGSLEDSGANYFGLPRPSKGGVLYGWRFSNFVEMFSKFYVPIVTDAGPRDVFMAEMFLNSFVYSVMISLFTIGTQIMVAYAVAKFKFRGKGFIYTLAIVVMIIPIVGSLASEMEFATNLGLKNSFIGVCIMRCKYPGMYFLVFYAAFKSISWTYAEAAQIDGAGHWRIFLTIMLPLVSSIIVAVFVLQFITNFNDYYTPMLFLPQYPTIAYGLYNIKSNSQINDTIKIAGTMFTCIPVVVLFIIFRNKIMGNVNVGGIKG